MHVTCSRCVHVNKNWLVKWIKQQRELQWSYCRVAPTCMGAESCLRSGLGLVTPLWDSSGNKLMREKTELNYQKGHFFHPPSTCRCWRPKFFFTYPCWGAPSPMVSPTEMEEDTNMIDGGQSLAAGNQEAELSQSKHCFCPGSGWNIRIFLLGLWFFWSQGQNLIILSLKSIWF